MNDLGHLQKDSWGMLQIGRRMWFFLYPSVSSFFKRKSKTFRADNGNMCKHVRWGMLHYVVTWWETEADRAAYFARNGE